MYADYNDLPLERVHVVVPDVGGGFGAKAVPYPEDLLLGVLAKAVGRPVLWAEDRSSSMQALAHGRDQVLDVTLGGTRDGRFTHYRLDVTQDAGAHADDERLPAGDDPDDDHGGRTSSRTSR